jgi:hypothetical protein
MFRSLLFRNFLALRVDRGRYCDMIIFPLSFLLSWGLLVWSKVLSEDQAVGFLLANLVWTLCSNVQTQTNLCMMVNLWSREYRELLNEGVKPHEMFVADGIFGVGIGIANLTIFALVIPAFSGSWEASGVLLLAFPSIVICALAVSSFVTGGITYLGKSWGFLSWTGLQAVIMFSAPFVPLEKLPTVFRYIALGSPFTYLFQFVRTGNGSDLAIGTGLGLVLLVLGILFLGAMVEKVRRGRGLHRT